MVVCFKKLLCATLIARVGGYGVLQPASRPSSTPPLSSRGVLLETVQAIGSWAGGGNGAGAAAAPLPLLGSDSQSCEAAMGVVTEQFRINHVDPDDYPRLMEGWCNDMLAPAKSMMGKQQAVTMRAVSKAWKHACMGARIALEEAQAISGKAFCTTLQKGFYKFFKSDSMRMLQQTEVTDVESTEPYAPPYATPLSHLQATAGGSASLAAELRNASAAAFSNVAAGPVTAADELARLHRVARVATARLARLRPCCNPHGGQGCHDAAISACVCAREPSCCSGSWTLYCTELVEMPDTRCGRCVDDETRHRTLRAN